ncbi:extracellular solute-binding protein [Candidatus Berkelbacteria bacterium]|nr:extracellular solute-binding protein [Candidatus Berkelbacteria bacterium]
MKRGVLIAFVVFGIIVVGLFVLLIRSGGDNNTAPTVKKISVWMPYDEIKTYQQISQRFVEENPDVTLEFKYIESKDAADYEAKVVDAIASEKGPDIWLVRSDWIPKHAPKSEPAFAEDETLNPIDIAKNRLIPAVVDLNIYDNKLYGVPLFADTLAVFYNEDFYLKYLDEATQAQQDAIGSYLTSWGMLRTQVSGISRSSGSTVTRSGIALGTAENTYAATDILSAFLVQSGVKILSDDKKDVTFNLAQFVNGKARFPATEALDFYTSFAKPGKANYSWNKGLGSGLSAFIGGRTATLIGYHSTLKQIVDANPSFKLKVATFPQINDSVKVADRVDFGVSWSHIVNKDSKNTGLAWKYLGYFMESSVLNQYSNLTDKISVELLGRTRPIPTELITADNAAEKIFLAQLQYLKPFIKPEWQETDEILQDAIKLIVNDNAKAQTSADTTAERFKKAFE